MLFIFNSENEQHLFRLSSHVLFTYSSGIGISGYQEYCIYNGTLFRLLGPILVRCTADSRCSNKTLFINLSSPFQFYDLQMPYMIDIFNQANSGLRNELKFSVFLSSLIKQARLPYLYCTRLPTIQKGKRHVDVTSILAGQYRPIPK